MFFCAAKPHKKTSRPAELRKYLNSSFEEHSGLIIQTAVYLTPSYGRNQQQSISILGRLIPHAHHNVIPTVNQKQV